METPRETFSWYVPAEHQLASSLQVMFQAISAIVSELTVDSLNRRHQRSILRTKSLPWTLLDSITEVEAVQGSKVKSNVRSSE
jgi:hypothetical protein